MFESNGRTQSEEGRERPAEILDSHGLTTLCQASTTTRDAASYSAQTGVHSADKLHVNRVVVNCDEFYEAYEITENDGMYAAPENRVKVW